MSAEETSFKNRLYAPEAYWKLPEIVKGAICNGCGTKGLGGLLVPDTLWGLDITEACNIHDYMYHVGKTAADKDEADRVFLNNMVRIIEAESWGGPIKVLRKRRARIYYEAVSHFGGPAFWAGKNKASELRPLAA